MGIATAERVPEGIKSLRARKTSFGAIITTATKDPKRGTPIRQGRFFIQSTQDEQIAGLRGFRALMHPMHPQFEQFNKLKDTDPRARTLRGHIFLPGPPHLLRGGRNEEPEDSSMSYQLAAQELGKCGRPAPEPHGGGSWGMPSNGAPACVGDGTRARRFAGEGEDGPRFIDIACPDELCPFQQKNRKGASDCGSFSRLYFVISWPDGNPLPRILVRYQSHGWETTQNMLGLYRDIDRAAHGMLLEPGSWNYSGAPFQMTVKWRIKPAQGRRFPVVEFTPIDPYAFLRWQVEERKFFATAPRSVALIAEGSGVDEMTPEGLGKAVQTMTFGSGIPGSAPEPAKGTKEKPPPGDVIDAEPVGEGEVELTPGERLAELAGSLSILPAVADKVARKVVGCDLADVPEEREADVAAALEKLS